MLDQLLIRSQYLQYTCILCAGWNAGQLLHYSHRLDGSLLSMKPLVKGDKSKPISPEQGCNLRTMVTNTVVLKTHSNEVLNVRLSHLVGWSPPSSQIESF